MKDCEVMDRADAFVLAFGPVGKVVLVTSPNSRPCPITRHRAIEIPPWSKVWGTAGWDEAMEGEERCILFQPGGGPVP